MTTFATGDLDVSECGWTVGFQSHGLLGFVVERHSICTVGFHSDCIKARIRTTTTCHFFERFADIHFLVVENFCLALFLGHLEAFRNSVKGDNTLSTEHKSALNRELSNWPTAPDGYDITGFNVAVFRCHVASGEDIGKKQYLVVCQSFRNLEQADIGKGNPRIFCLTASIATEQVRIAEES